MRLLEAGIYNFPEHLSLHYALAVIILKWHAGFYDSRLNGQKSTAPEASSGSRGPASSGSQRKTPDIDEMYKLLGGLVYGKAWIQTGKTASGTYDRAGNNKGEVCMTSVNVCLWQKATKTSEKSGRRWEM